MKLIKFTSKEFLGGIVIGIVVGRFLIPKLTHAMAGRGGGGGSHGGGLGAAGGLNMSQFCPSFCQGGGKGHGHGHKGGQGGGGGGGSDQ